MSLKILSECCPKFPRPLFSISTFAKNTSLKSEAAARSIDSLNSKDGSCLAEAGTPLVSSSASAAPGKIEVPTATSFADPKPSCKATILKGLSKEKELSITPFEFKGHSSLSAFKAIKANDVRVAHFYNSVHQTRLRTQASYPGSQEEAESVVSFTQFCDVQPAAYSIVKIVNANKLNVSCKPEPEIIDLTSEFICKYCGEEFNSGQALGGHMSRKHAGRSERYNHKKKVRKQRELERARLQVAKAKYFQRLGHNYEGLRQSAEGKLMIRLLINRSRVKKLKARLTEGEVYGYLNGANSGDL